MTALVQYAYESFTGPNIANMERLPAFLPVAGYDRRFHAQAFASAKDGTAVSSWLDATGSGTALTPSGSGVTGATAPSVATMGNEKVVRFNGVADSLGQLYSTPEPYTLTLAFYLPEAKPDSWLMSVADGALLALFTNATNILRWYGERRAQGPELKVGWHVVTVTANGAETAIRLDESQESTLIAGGVTYTRNRLTLAGSTQNTNRARLDVAECIHWPRPLSAQEVTTVHSALKTRYGI